MRSDEVLTLVLDALKARFEAAGRGSIGRVTAALGVGEGYFRNVRRYRSLDIAVLFKTLDLLEVDAREFFAASLGSMDVIDEFKREAAELPIDEPRILERARRRMEAEGEDRDGAGGGNGD